MFQKSLLLLFLFRMLTGCLLFSPMKDNKLSVGDIPEELVLSLSGSWTVVMSSTSGDPRVIEIDREEGGLPEHIFIESPKEEDSLLLLYPPPIAEGCRMNPLGGFIPSYRDYGELTLRDGSAVSILMTLRQNNLRIEDFNCQRFITEMAELDDPWLVEDQTLLKQLGRREMRSWYIRTKTMFEVEIALPPGHWYGASLLQPPLESSVEDTHTLSLPEGYSFLYCPERSELLEIQVDSHGEAVWIIVSLPQGVSI